MSLWLAVGVLVGGRVVEVAFDEWPFYRQHLSLIPAFWLGGMATHGLLVGAAVGYGLLRGSSSESHFSSSPTRWSFLAPS